MPGPIRLSIAAVSLLLLSACAAPPTTVALNPEVGAQIGSSNGVVVVSQATITAEIERSQMTQAAGGGALFAILDILVEESRTKSAEEVLEPIRDSLIGYDFHDDLVSSLRPVLMSTQWLGITRVEGSSDPASDLQERLLKDGSEDALVLIHASYGLSSDFTALNSEARLEVHPRAASLKTLVESTRQSNSGHVPLYRVEVGHVEYLPAPATTREEAAQAWLAADGQAARRALEATVEHIVAMLAAKLRAPYSSP